MPMAVMVMHAKGPPWTTNFGVYFPLKAWTKHRRMQVITIPKRQLMPGG